MDSEDFIYNADGTVTVIKNDQVVGTFPQTGGGYGSPGTNPTAPTGGYSSTDKKWWETAIGALPGIFAGIFGNTNQNNQPVNYPYPTTQTGSSFGGSNMIIIVAVAAVAILLLMKNK